MVSRHPDRWGTGYWQVGHLFGFEVLIAQAIASYMANERSYKEVLMASNPVREEMAHW